MLENNGVRKIRKYIKRVRDTKLVHHFFSCLLFFGNLVLFSSLINCHKRVMSISSECSVSGMIKSQENTMFARTFSFMTVNEINFAVAAPTPSEPDFVASMPDLNLMPIDDYTYQQSDLPGQMDVNKAQTAEPDQNAQMTIFYAGKVYVFNDVPANKAKDIMFLTSLGSSANNTRRYHNFPQPIDLPMKRKASLTRFFEKRKDRIMARAPYTMTGESQGPSKVHENKPWISLASSP